MNDTERAELGARIRRARDDKGLSQAQLAAQTGITENTIRAMEQGRKVWDRNLNAVLTALDITTGSTYSPETELIRDFIGEWFENLPAAEKAHHRRRLMRLPFTDDDGQPSPGSPS